MPDSNFGDYEQREEDPSGYEQRGAQEKLVHRNPHPDFNKVEASRPDWAERSEWHFTKTKQPGWKLGQGANDGGESLEKKHVEINPYEQGRPAVFNYKLLISGIIPRPIGFVSTRSKDGQPRALQRLFPSVSGLTHPLRLLHEPRPLLLHQRHQPRPAPLHHRLRGRPLPRQGHAAQPHSQQGMHHQHHQRALHRGGQCHEHKCALWHLRMVLERSHARPVHGGQGFARQGGDFQHRREAAVDDGV